MNVSEITNERLRILSLGREQANCEETVCFAQAELAKRNGDGDMRDFEVKHLKLKSEYPAYRKIEATNGWWIVEIGEPHTIAGAVIFEAVRSPFQGSFNDWNEITAAEYEAAKSPLSVAVAGEAKEKPEQVFHEMICDRMNCPDTNCTHYSCHNETPSCFRIQRGVCGGRCVAYAATPTPLTKPLPVTEAEHLSAAKLECDVLIEKIMDAVPPAKQVEPAEPWNTSVSHFMQLEEIRRKHDALEAEVREIRKERVG